MGKKAKKQELREQQIFMLHEEYKIARHELEYYTELFNKQDNLYSIYFAIFAVVIGAIYYVIKENNVVVFENMALNFNQKLLIAGLIIFLAITYMYLFVIVMGNSYYLIIYSEKIIVIEKKLNQLLGKKILFWESDFMSVVQSTQNIFTKGYLNVNILKLFYAIALYVAVELPLGAVWFFVFEKSILSYTYIGSVMIISLFLLRNWLIMWIRLPKHYREKLNKVYCIHDKR